MWRLSPRVAEQLSRYWDARGAGRPTTAREALDLDPILIDTVEHLYAHDAPFPDPRFLNRLEHTLMDTIVLPAGHTPGSGPPVSPNGRVAVLSRPGPSPVLPDATGRGRWVLAPLATAALVLLILIGSYVAFGGPLHVGRMDDTPAMLPALNGTPEASPVPGVTEDAVVFDQVFADIPALATWARLARTTLQPGASMIQGTPEHHGVGPMVYRIDAGSVTGQADGPIEVTRGGAASATRVAANTEIVLATGDVAFAPAGVGIQWRNAGSTPATVLESGVAIPPPAGSDARMNNGTVVPGWTAGDVSFEDLIDDYSTFVHPPTAPAELTVTQVTIAPGASLPSGPEPGLKLVSVETGTLTAVWANRSDPSVQTGTHEAHAGTWMDVNESQFIAKELRNDGTEPVVLLVMTITPMGTSTATPTP